MEGDLLGYEVAVYSDGLKTPCVFKPYFWMCFSTPKTDCDYNIFSNFIVQYVAKDIKKT
jgi:hypothetical protein